MTAAALSWIALLAALDLNPPMERFRLTETPEEVRRAFKERPHVIDTVTQHVLQFHGEEHAPGCDQSRQWVFYFDKRESRLVSLTRHLEAPAALSTLLPRSATLRRFETPEGFPVLRAALRDGREFLVVGATSLKDRVSQLQLLKTEDVTRFYPDIRPAR